MWFRRKPHRPRSLGQALEALPHGWFVDRIPTGRVAVGPAGVYLLGEFADSESAVEAAKQLRQAIDDEVGLKLWVQAVCVRWGRFSELVEQESHVFYVHGANVAPWLASRPGMLSLRQCHAVEDAFRDRAA
jgi:hypothetical protein